MFKANNYNRPMTFYSSLNFTLGIAFSLNFSGPRLKMRIAGFAAETIMLGKVRIFKKRGEPNLTEGFGYDMGSGRM